jgi:hypothetical protein
MSSIIKVDTVQDQDGNNIINENANTITIGASGDTITIPSGATLANNGTATGFASIAWQSSIVTAATLTAEAGKGYWINTTSNACTITLPASASVGDQIIFSDYLRTWGTNAVTINPNSLNFQGNTSPNPVYNTSGQSVNLVYSGATQGWIPNSDDDVTLETPQAVDTEYLVVAGGGSGGRGDGGGGGAGGHLTNFGGTAISLTPGATYTVTVGGGGAASTSNGNSGSNSVLSGTGISTVTSIGGGNGSNGTSPAIGGDGGSGGGGGHFQPSGAAGGSGTVGQGNDGGDGAGNLAPAYGGGGGGGAGAAGANGSGSSGGNGGDGLSNSITGSAVFYAGGGGGFANNGDGDAGAGGNGGGSAGKGGSAGVAATANTGGGGGGTAGTPSGAGGSGVVILRMATSRYSGTTTGSPTVTTDGSDTVIKFTGDGSYTA